MIYWISHHLLLFICSLVIISSPETIKGYLVPGTLLISPYCTLGRCGEMEKFLLHVELPIFYTSSPCILKTR